jgi:hypothetical protein
LTTSSKKQSEQKDALDFFSFRFKEKLENATQMHINKQGNINLMKANFFIASLILLSLIPLASAANTYEFTGYKGTPYSLGADNGIPFNYSGTCSIQMSTTTTYTIGPSYISHVEWYSPTTSAPIGTADVSYTSSSSCRTSGGTSLQSVSKDITTGIYENKISFAPLSATGGFAQTKTRYRCDANGGKWVNITVTPDNTSYGACQWQMTDRNPISNSYTQPDLISDFISGYNDCGASNFVNRFGQSECSVYEGVLCPGAYCNATLMYVYPFNSTGGYITYHFSIPNKIAGGQDHFAYYPNGINIYYAIQLINLQTDISLLILSTDSATIATDSAIFKNMTVLGNTVLGDTVVNGKLNIGMLTLDNTDSSINAIGTLKLQSLALGGIDIMNGLVTIDTGGKSGWEGVLTYDQLKEATKDVLILPETDEREEL